MVSGGASCLTNHNKITIGRRFFLHKQPKESFTLIDNIPGTTPVQYFPKLKNPDGSNVIGEGWKTSITNHKRLDLCPHTLELVTV